MTSRLRRRPPTTARVPSTPARRAASAAWLAVLAVGGVAPAQDLGRPAPSPYSTWPPAASAVAWASAPAAARAPRLGEPDRLPRAVQRTFFQAGAGPGGTDEGTGYQIQL